MRGVCVGCERDRFIHGSGRCVTCYRRLQAARPRCPVCKRGAATALGGACKGCTHAGPGPTTAALDAIEAEQRARLPSWWESAGPDVNAPEQEEGPRVAGVLRLRLVPRRGRP